VHFKIEAQPATNQRKSYTRENRFVSPNPIRILYQGTPGRLAEGSVSVSLVKSDGKTKVTSADVEEVSTSEEDNHNNNSHTTNNNNNNTNNNSPPSRLTRSASGGAATADTLCCLGGSLVQRLDQDNRAEFSLKCLATSKGRYFRLLFEVRFHFHGESVDRVETLYSNAFKVTSNKKGSKRPLGVSLPVMEALMPPSGSLFGNTEVWIRGENFSDEVKVFFDDQEAFVLQARNNVITCLSPFFPMSDSSVECVTQVRVVNVQEQEGGSKEHKDCEQTLTFKYVAMPTKQFSVS